MTDSMNINASTSEQMDISQNDSTPLASGETTQDSQFWELDDALEQVPHVVQRNAAIKKIHGLFERVSAERDKLRSENGLFSFIQHLFVSKR